MRLANVGFFHVWGIPVDTSVIPFLVPAYLLVFIAKSDRHADSGGERPFPLTGFMAVGLLPAFYLTLVCLGITSGSWSAWPIGVGTGSIFVGLIIIWAAAEFSNPGSVVSELASSKMFINRLAGAGDAAAFTPAGQRRRELAFTVDGFLTFVAGGLAAFVYLYTFLGQLGYGVHLASATSLSAYRDAAVRYVGWHTFDLVPVLQIPETLKWTLAHPFTGRATGWILLGLKVFVVLIVLRLVVRLWKRNPQEDG